MFHPVGSQPPSVYWRRRLLLLAAIALVLVLIVLTVSTLLGGDGSPQGAGTGGASAGTTPTTSSPPATTRPPSTTSSSSRASQLHSSSAPASTSAAPQPCALNSLQLRSTTGKSVYPSGSSPVVALQVTNTGSEPCTRDLSDAQIELRVYNGTSRVWGSHDCAVQKGTRVQTLAAGHSYLFQIAWTALTSAPGKCADGQRQKVGAGSYTLYASLSGKTATAASFQID